MTRPIPPSLAGILQELELEQPLLVTTAQLAELVERHEIGTPVRVVAARLRQRGWLLPTGRRGVWEFAPAAAAGAYSQAEPLTPLRAFLAADPAARCGLTFQAAAWAQGVADRVAARIEVAAATSQVVRRLPDGVAASVFEPRLDYQELRGVPVLAVASVVVHMAASPGAVRSWSSAVEWLPDLSAEIVDKDLQAELQGRPGSVSARAGYLLQGMRPDLSEAIRSSLGSLRGKTWFGPRGPLVHHDNRWQIADTTLPFDPRHLASVR